MRFFHLGWFLASLYWYCFLSTSLILWIVIDYIVHDTSLYKNVLLQQKVKQIASGKFKKPINLYTSSLHVPYMVCRNARVWAITKQLLMNILSCCLCYNIAPTSIHSSVYQFCGNCNAAIRIFILDAYLTNE